jgi:restriction system protein
MSDRYGRILCAAIARKDMARRNKGLLDTIASLPWPVGIILGIIVFASIRYGIGWYFAAGTSSLTQGVVRLLGSNGGLTLFAWMFLAIFWLGAFVSWLTQRKRAKLLDGQTGLESLSTLSWREFELLVAEAFHRQGYTVEQTGLGGADGGVDIILHKDGRRELVQCKQWRKAQVNVAVVREMWGLAAHHRVDAVKVVCAGEFTPDAKAFAQRKPIELINGSRLADLIREVQGARAKRLHPITVASAAPSCPVCAAAMTLRRNGSTGDSFWGCSTYPQCRGTRKMAKGQSDSTE